MRTLFVLIASGLTAAALLAPLQARAHGEAAHGQAAPMQGRPAALSTDEHAFGREGDPRKATRTITVNMADTMRFSPERITVKEGETVRFVVANKGKLLHELVLGTDAELQKHAELMRKFPDMEHEEPYMVHVKPGGRGGFAWTFTKAGTFSFACLVPGHFEAGMKGRIVVTQKKPWP